MYPHEARERTPKKTTPNKRSRKSYENEYAISEQEPEEGAASQDFKHLMNEQESMLNDIRETFYATEEAKFHKMWRSKHEKKARREAYLDMEEENRLAMIAKKEALEYKMLAKYTEQIEGLKTQLQTSEENNELALMEINVLKARLSESERERGKIEVELMQLKLTRLEKKFDDLA